MGPGAAGELHEQLESAVRGGVPGQQLAAHARGDEVHAGLASAGRCDPCAEPGHEGAPDDASFLALVGQGPCNQSEEDRGAGRGAGIQVQGRHEAGELLIAAGDELAPSCSLALRSARESSGRDLSPSGVGRDRAVGRPGGPGGCDRRQGQQQDRASDAAVRSGGDGHAPG